MKSALRVASETVRERSRERGAAHRAKCRGVCGVLRGTLRTGGAWNWGWTVGSQVVTGGKQIDTISDTTIFRINFRIGSQWWQTQQSTGIEETVGSTTETSNLGYTGRTCHLGNRHALAQVAALSAMLAASSRQAMGNPSWDLSGFF